MPHARGSDARAPCQRKRKDQSADQPRPRARANPSYHPDLVAGPALMQVQAQIAPSIDLGKAHVRLSVVDEFPAGFSAKTARSDEFLKCQLLRHVRSPTVDV